MVKTADGAATPVNCGFATRRQLIRCVGAALAQSAAMTRNLSAGRPAQAADEEGVGGLQAAKDEHVAYGESTLPRGVRSRFVHNVNGLTMHVLEAGYEPSNRPCLLLLHGFPELAYSWRKVMLPLAEAGFHVIAPDQRGSPSFSATGFTTRSNSRLRSIGEFVRIEKTKSSSAVNEHSPLHSSRNSITFLGTVTVRIDLGVLGEPNEEG